MAFFDRSAAGAAYTPVSTHGHEPHGPAGAGAGPAAGAAGLGGAHPIAAFGMSPMPSRSPYHVGPAAAAAAASRRTTGPGAPPTFRAHVRALTHYLRRLTRRSQMDFEAAWWHLRGLLVAPRRVYRTIAHHKQTKNQWARDDPAFVVLATAGVAVLGLLRGLFGGVGLVATLQGAVRHVLVDFLLVGVVMATATWAMANHWLVASSLLHTTDQTVEWAYAFDVHCNAAVPVFLVLDTTRLLLASWLACARWWCLLGNNTLLLVAASYYVYMTFLGYSTLPFVRRAHVLLVYPMGAFGVLWLLATLCGYAIPY